MHVLFIRYPPVRLDDWRDVDELIIEIGDWLHERDLKLQVGIYVGAILAPARARARDRREPPDPPVRSGRLVPKS